MILNKGRGLEVLVAKIQDEKKRGEWAELLFMARATEEGLRVSKPWGDSSRYDVTVEYGGRFRRVQVKSTMCERRKGSYSLNVMGPRRQPYARADLDFLAVYLVPIAAWYIIPFAKMLVRNRTLCSLHFTVGSKREKYRAYREAWHLLRK